MNSFIQEAIATLPKVSSTDIFNFLSVCANIGLLYLYRQQQKILKLDRLPSIEISNIVENGDEVTLSVANYGDGLAKDLKIRTSVELVDENNEVIKVKQRLNRVDDSGEISSERAIRSEQRDVHFKCTPGFGFSDEERYRNFSSGVYMAVTEENIQKFNFRVDLCYSNQLDEEYTIRVLENDRFIELSDERLTQIENGQDQFTFEEAILSSGIIPEINESPVERIIRHFKMKWG